MPSSNSVKAQGRQARPKKPENAKLLASRQLTRPTLFSLLYPSLDGLSCNAVYEDRKNLVGPKSWKQF